MKYKPFADNPCPVCRKPIRLEVRQVETDILSIDCPECGETLEINIVDGIVRTVYLPQN